MKIINSYIKRLKFANHLILTIPSKPTLRIPATDKEIIQPNLRCKSTVAKKSNEKVRKKLKR